jgi:hypothetical protein
MPGLFVADEKVDFRDLGAASGIRKSFVFRNWKSSLKATGNGSTFDRIFGALAAWTLAVAKSPTSKIAVDFIRLIKRELPHCVNQVDSLFRHA